MKNLLIFVGGVCAIIVAVTIDAKLHNGATTSLSLLAIGLIAGLIAVGMKKGGGR